MKTKKLSFTWIRMRKVFLALLLFSLPLLSYSWERDTLLTVGLDMKSFFPLRSYEAFGAFGFSDKFGAKLNLGFTNQQKNSSPIRKNIIDFHQKGFFVKPGIFYYYRVGKKQLSNMLFSLNFCFGSFDTDFTYKLSDFYWGDYINTVAYSNVIYGLQVGPTWELLVWRKWFLSFSYEVGIYRLSSTTKADKMPELQFPMEGALIFDDEGTRYGMNVQIYLVKKFSY